MHEERAALAKDEAWESTCIASACHGLGACRTPTPSPAPAPAPPATQAFNPVAAVSGRVLTPARVQARVHGDGPVPEPLPAAAAPAPSPVPH